EPLFLDLVQQLAERSSGAPILLLALARDELREERPDFLERAEELALQALSPAETDALVDALCGETGPAGDTRRRIVEAAEGNPLYLEQLVALAAEEGGFDPGRPLPATIQALLLARLDRLGPGERAVLERAAVVGREFGRGAVADLLDPAAAATVGRHLEVLVRRGFLRPAAAAAA